MEAQVNERSIKHNVFQTTQKTEIICTITYNDVSFIMYLEKPYKNNNDLEDMICRCDITINNKLVTSTTRMSYDKGLQNKIDLWNNLSLAIRDKNDTNTKFYAIRLFNALFYDYIKQETNKKINNAAVYLNNVQHELEEPIVVEPHDDSQQQIKIVNNDNNKDNNDEIAKNIANNKKTTLNNCLYKMCNFRC